MDITFRAELFEWRGPAPYFWLALPTEACDDVRTEAATASYGWGAVPVCVCLGETAWETSLLPRDGGYVLPVKNAVRATTGLGEGDEVTVCLSVVVRGGRPASGSARTSS
jgi:hypothetical protein